MQISELTLRLIVLLIPGTIAAIIVEKLTIHKSWSAFSFILYSVLLGSVAYFFHQVLLYAWELNALLREHPYNPKSLIFWISLIDTSTPISLGEVATTSFVAILTGYLVSALINHKLLFRSAKLIGVSKKFGDEDLWAYFLNSPEVQWVWVRDHSRNLVYEGWVQSFSVTPPIREILLREVKVYSNDTEVFMYGVPAMYVSGTPENITIELPRFREEEVDYGKEVNSRRNREGSDQT